MMSHNTSDSEMYERERVVFETIKNNPNLHHNALLKQIVPEFMAKTTFEKTRDSLLEKGIISVNHKGNMKFYIPTENYEEKLQHRIERNTNNSYHDLKLKIKKLDTDYSHKDVDEFWMGLRASFPSAKFEIHHQIGREDPMMPPRAAIRWSLQGKHDGWGAFGNPTGADVYIMGVCHAEFGPWGLRREFALYDETAIWKQILLQTGEGISA